MKRLLRCLLLTGLLLGLGAPGVSWAASYFLPAAADAYVNGSAPDANYGSEQYLHVAAFGYQETQSTYLKFDLRDIPAGESITGAILVLSVYGINNSYGNICLFYINYDSWGETTITWNNRPWDVSSLLDPGWQLAVGYSGFGVCWDLMANGNWTPDTDGEVSLWLFPMSQTCSFEFFSKEYNDPDFHPLLFVTTSEVPLPGAFWLLGSGLLGLARLRGFRRG